MGAFEFFWAITALMVPILVAVALVMVNPPNEDFRRARGCFWTSAAMGVVVLAMWGAQSPLAFWARTIVACVVASAITVGLMGALRWVREREAAISKIAPPKSEEAPQATQSTEAAPVASIPPSPPAGNEQAHVATAPLTRLINYPAGHSFEGTRKADGGQLLGTVSFDIKNVGADPLHLKLVEGAIYEGTRTLMRCEPIDAKYVGTGETVRVLCKPAEPDGGFMGNDSKSLTLRTHVTYDTIPSTGLRVSVRESVAPVYAPTETTGLGIGAFVVVESDEH